MSSNRYLMKSDARVAVKNTAECLRRNGEWLECFDADTRKHRDSQKRELSDIRADIQKGRDIQSLQHVRVLDGSAYSVSHSAPKYRVAHKPHEFSQLLQTMVHASPGYARATLSPAIAFTFLVSRFSRTRRCWSPAISATGK